MSLPPTKEEIREVAQEAVDIFEDQGLSSCLFGSAGCELYGRNRVPNDVDLIVMSNSWDPEDLKNLLVINNASFYTRAARQVGATYRVLFYRLPGRRRSCKVDILIPGVMNIPKLPRSRLVHIDGLPVLPFVVLLMLKVQGWSDHRWSEREDMRSKEDVDVRDINEMLVIGRRRGESLARARWIPRAFFDRGLELINDYIDINGGSTYGWERLGLEFA